MKTELMSWFDMEAPIFAFSHCRDVVAAVSRAGGLGVLGTTHVTPEQLDLELNWIDEHCDGRPYGVDVMFASNPPKEAEGLTADDFERVIPEEHRNFVESVMDRYEVPKLPADESRQVLEEYMADLLRTHAEAEKRLEVVYRHPTAKLIVSALGVPPQHQIDRAHDLGLKVGALVGHPKHVKYHKNAGVDMLIAAGWEAAGHTGDIATFVLTPQIVDEAGSIPVCHAGGVSDGRQIAAAMALGAQAVWTGTIWLATAEAETSELIKEKMFAATSGDTIRSRCGTGKPTRRMVSGWTDAWEEEGAPKPLPMPYQSMLINEALYRMDKFEPKELVTYPAGQGVGMIHQRSEVRHVVYKLLEEFGDAVVNLNQTIEGE